MPCSGICHCLPGHAPRDQERMHHPGGLLGSLAKVRTVRDRAQRPDLYRERGRERSRESPDPDPQVEDRSRVRGPYSGSNSQRKGGDMRGRRAQTLDRRGGSGRKRGPLPGDRSSRERVHVDRAGVYFTDLEEGGGKGKDAGRQHRFE